MLKLQVGDKFAVPKCDTLPHGVQIEITGLGTGVTYMASGEDVIDPDKPRELSAVVFVNWLDGSGAKRI